MIRSVANAFIPVSLRYMWREWSLRRMLRSEPRRIVLGASGVFESGWIPTDAEQFDLLEGESWSRYVEPNSIDTLLAEHVWEHLTIEEGRRAAATCYRYLRAAGYIRVAVPDGFFPDPAFQEYIKVGGAAGGSDPLAGHKTVYTYRTLRDVFESVGFSTMLLEYHDETGTFHERHWDPADGLVHRSRRFDSRGAISIVLDARK